MLGVRSGAIESNQTIALRPRSVGQWEMIVRSLRRDLFAQIGLAIVVLLTLVSLAFLVPLRGRLVRWIGSGEDVAKSVDALVGQIAVLLDDLPPGAVGKAELRGTAWNARNGDAQALRKGQRGKVTRVDGLTLWLQAE